MLNRTTVNHPRAMDFEFRAALTVRLRHLPVTMAQKYSVRKTIGGRPFLFSRTMDYHGFFLSAQRFYCYNAKSTTSESAVHEPVPSTKGSSSYLRQKERRLTYPVNLPKTNFSLRANVTQREPEIQKLWDDNQVFRRVINSNNKGSFILHDGPPYANGNLHMGHALNKILKDIINRYKLLQNFRVCYIPGWDCHGLPIEQKVLQSMSHDARKILNPLDLREKAAKFALETVKSQMNSFKRYGIWADWENCYLTLSPDYEAAQIGLFGEMVNRGYIYRGRKPVYWSPSSRTALAEAELEYSEVHISKSIYAMLKLVGASTSSVGFLDAFLPNLFLVIWTTTPWTIPANAAVAVNGELLYAVAQMDMVLSDSSLPPISKNLKHAVGRKLFVIVALDLVPRLQSKWGVKLSVHKVFKGLSLEQYRYIHPIDQVECPVVNGEDYVSVESGTGLVHIAPGHGHQDYIVGQKYGLPAWSPVDDDGKFTEDAGEFSSLDVSGEGTVAVIKYLDNKSLLLMQEPYTHKYAYDWRTKKPTIIRATEQWFACVEGFRKIAMEAVRHVQWVPSQAENRIAALISGRSDWCISRQRSWGVPIPVFYHNITKQPLLNDETISHIKSIISKKGSDAWWNMTVRELLPESYRNQACDYLKGTDTMDVWFDSGSSWAAVLQSKIGFLAPADLCLEGTDQHRGWFQSCLLTSVATTGQPPFSHVITHGFVLDEKGLKMSKSMGNVVDPDVVIGGGKNKGQLGYGADVLRLWVSSVDYTGDVPIGPKILQQMSEMYRKLRGTLRYLLGNLHDWHPTYAVPYDDLAMIDKHALFQFGNVINRTKEFYENYEFCKIFQILQRFTIVYLSNFYFDVVKDRLYCGTLIARRCCQTVLAYLMNIARLIAPILPHLAEDAWQHLPYKHLMEDGSAAEFIFEAKWPVADERWTILPTDQIDLWTKILELRTEVNKVLEAARMRKVIGSSLEAQVYLHASDPCLSSRLVEQCASEHEVDHLRQIFITSKVSILSCHDNCVYPDVVCSGTYFVDSESKIWIGVSRADGSKCERCYSYCTELGTFSGSHTLCGRCYAVVSCL